MWASHPTTYHFKFVITTANGRSHRIAPTTDDLFCAKKIPYELPRRGLIIYYISLGVRLECGRVRLVEGDAGFGENALCLFNLFGRRGSNSLERIAEIKLFPFKLAHLVEGEKLNAFYALKVL